MTIENKIKKPKIDWHTLEKNQVLEVLNSTTDGLTDDEATKRIEIYGPNTITEKKQKHPALIFVKQFKEPLILILLFATIISGFVGDLIDAAVIVAIVLLSVSVAFVQEYRSEKAIEALKKMTVPTTRVIRDGKEKIVRVNEIVPGDIIHVVAGDRVPADAYLVEGFNLKVNESPLTGESIPIKKNVNQLDKHTPVSDRANILHTITTVTYGRGKAVVFATGMNTEVGKIAAQVQGIDLQKTPFEIRMKHLSKLLGIIMIAVAGIMSILAFFRGYDLLELLVWGISVAVAAVPEALPMVIAASLTVGVYNLAKKHAIIRRLPAVETLGSTTIVCSDKTGTLTKGEMTVKKIFLPDGESEVTGVGYNFDGSVVNPNINKNNLFLLAKNAALCNDASIKFDGTKPIIIGDTMEAALIVFANKVGIIKDHADAKFPRIHEEPFTSERKRMSTIHDSGNKFEIFMKGACEVVLEHCNTILVEEKLVPIDENKARIMEVNNQMASHGLRVLAFAYKEIPKENFSEKQLESSLTFIGLVGLIDPPREETIGAIEQCRSAGIDVMMITGDHKLTAMAVAREIGISDVKAISGQDLDRMTVTDLITRLEQTKVYSRVSPENKLKIIDALKRKGHIVAMTGDGINDAPALKAADIGISMGITGTQVAKESSSMILANDNFATIVHAIKEGRRIFDNVKKYITFVLAGNIGEIVILASSLIMGWPIPLLAKHILYINLATNGTPAIALGLEKHEPDIMKRKPRKPNESVFSGTKKWLVGIPILLSAMSLALFGIVLESNGWNSEDGIIKARTMMFGFIVFFELFFALSCRSFRHNINKLGLFSNRLLVYALIGESLLILFIMNYSVTQQIFDLVSLEPMEWIVILSLATVGFIYSELIKLITRAKAIIAT